MITIVMTDFWPICNIDNLSIEKCKLINQPEHTRLDNFP